MNDDAIMENHAGIVDNLRRVIKLENQILVLDARILKLEEIIVKVCNAPVPEEEHHYSIEDLAEKAQQRREDEDEGIH